MSKIKEIVYIISSISVKILQLLKQQLKILNWFKSHLFITLHFRIPSHTSLKYNKLGLLKLNNRNIQGT